MCMAHNMHTDFFFNQHPPGKQTFPRILIPKKREGEEQRETATAVPEESSLYPWCFYQTSAITPPAQELQHLCYHWEKPGHYWRKLVVWKILSMLSYTSTEYMTFEVAGMQNLLEITCDPFSHGPVSFGPFLFQNGHITTWSQRESGIPGQLAALVAAICSKDWKIRPQLVLGNLHSLAKGTSVPSVPSLILAYRKWEISVNRG